jgi:hypothetical protein
VLVQVWQVTTTPQFYIFGNLQQVEQALGSQYAASLSWRRDGRYNVTTPGPEAIERMQEHRDRWDRIVDQL